MVPAIFAPVGEAIEQRDAVSLGPQPDAAGILEGRVFDVEQGVAIVDNDLANSTRNVCHCPAGTGTLTA
jgi:hypothetical protein